MSPRPGNTLAGLFLESLADADDSVKRELAAYLRPYLADGPGRLLECLNAIEHGEFDAACELVEQPARHYFDAVPAPWRRQRRCAGRRRPLPARWRRSAAVPSFADGLDRHARGQQRG